MIRSPKKGASPKTPKATVWTAPSPTRKMERQQTTPTSEIRLIIKDGTAERKLKLLEEPEQRELLKTEISALNKKLAVYIDVHDS